jgi:hypothetical protein
MAAVGKKKNQLSCDGPEPLETPQVPDCAATERYPRSLNEVRRKVGRAQAMTP